MGTGWKKIAMKKIENVNNRRVTFCKRRQGLFKKAAELSLLTGCRVAVLTMSSANKTYFYGDDSLLEEALALAAAASLGNLNTLSSDAASLDVGSFTASTTTSEEGGLGQLSVSGRGEGGDDNASLFTADEELSVGSDNHNHGCDTDAATATSSSDMKSNNNTIFNDEHAFMYVPSSSSAMTVDYYYKEEMHMEMVPYDCSNNANASQSVPSCSLAAAESECHLLVHHLSSAECTTIGDLNGGSHEQLVTKQSMEGFWEAGDMISELYSEENPLIVL